MTRELEKLRFRNNKYAALGKSRKDCEKPYFMGGTSVKQKESLKQNNNLISDDELDRVAGGQRMLTDILRRKNYVKF